MVYSINQEPNNDQNDTGSPDYVSAAIMAKVLEERSKERNLRNGNRVQQCQTCRRCVEQVDNHLQLIVID